MLPSYNSKPLVFSLLILAMILLVLSHNIENLAVKTSIIILQLIISIYTLFHVCTVYFKQKLSLQKNPLPKQLPLQENH